MQRRRLKSRLKPISYQDPGFSIPSMLHRPIIVIASWVPVSMFVSSLSGFGAEDCYFK